MSNQKEIKIKDFMGTTIYLNLENNKFYCNVGIKASNKLGMTYAHKTHSSVRLAKLEEAVRAELNTDFPEKLILLDFNRERFSEHTVIGRNGNQFYFKGGNKCNLSHIKHLLRWGELWFPKPTEKNKLYEKILQDFELIGKHREVIQGYLNKINSIKERTLLLAEELQKEETDERKFKEGYER